MKKMNDRNKRLATKLISLFAAIIIWVFVTYTENPQIDTAINDIPLQLSGEVQLEKNELMLLNKTSLTKGSLNIRGKRRDLMSVMGNITATLDLSGITSPGTYAIKPSYDIPSNAVYITKRNTNEVEIEVGKIAYKTLDVKTVSINAEKNKSFVVESVPEIKSVTIGGAYDDIKSIQAASLHIDVSSMLSDNTNAYKIVYENEDGAEVLPINTIFSDIDEINVTNYVYDKKTLEVKLDVPSHISNKYSFKILSQSLKSVDAGIIDENGEKVTSLSPSAYSFNNIKPGIDKYIIPLEIPRGIFVPEEKRAVEVEMEVSEVSVSPNEIQTEDNTN